MKKIGRLMAICWAISHITIAQSVYESGDAWGNFRQRCVAIVQGGEVYRSTSGGACFRESCAYIVQGNRIFRSSASLCFRDKCEWVFDGRYLYPSADTWGNTVGAPLFWVEDNVVYETSAAGWRGMCRYYWRDNKVYAARSGMPSPADDCILIIEGELSAEFPLALLAILAKRF